MKRVIVLLLFWGFVCHAYSQNNKQVAYMTIEEMIDSTLRFVQHYDYEPIYTAKIESSASFIIKTNDVPVGAYFGPAAGASIFHLNKAILKSGMQEMSIEIYPEYADKTIQKKALNNRVQLKLTIIKRYKTKNLGISEPEIVAIFDLQEQLKRYGISLSSKEVYRDTLRFDAEVLYALTGWTKSEDLTKIDREELKERVVAFYTRHHSFYQGKDSEGIIRTEFKRTQETSQTAYESKEKIATEKSFLDTFFSEIKYEMIPLENYEMQFFGNGRMVALIRTDGRNRGASALRYKATSNKGSKRLSWVDLLLHIPEGSSELEVIR